ncbi:hypothetical protein FPZ12_024100 [Amycolatopsis acidicola]|uniref:ParB/Sulfiredoxin domain-containing protein n=1 Tax=Amycolatopsis acidicola TaxID=2596893 RepID=A0A5N0V0J9_9PSEU|nr:hypothetical protein [Amycolatopsis acidicola]KAA9157967.1 hypothetical protein FPZ12_024100 [Amycolatopsis acidicola]
MTSTVNIPAQREDEQPAATVDEDPRQRRAEWENEYDRVIYFNPDDVTIDDNVRTENAVTDADTIRDMRRRGVDMAARGYRADDGTVMITMGQRRVLNARAAGCQLPVWMQAPPSADSRKAGIDRIVAQVNENDLRKGLTRGDEHRAVQQLAAFDLTPTGIARKLSRRVSHVKNVLTVGDSELASRAADRYDLTLDQAAVVAEFEGYGDLDTAKELVRLAVAAPNNFKVFAERKRNDRAEDERIRVQTAELTEQLTQTEVPILDSSVSSFSGPVRRLDALRATPDSEPGSRLTEDEHASCPGHAAWIRDDYDTDDNRMVVPVFACTDFLAHGHALANAPEGAATFSTSSPSAPAAEASPLTAGDGTAAAEERAREARKIQRRWVRENNKDWDAAVSVRQAWLASLPNRTRAPKGAQVFLAKLKAQGNRELRRAMERHHKLAHKLLNLPEPGYGQPSELPSKIATLSTAKATLYDTFLTLCALEEDLSRDAWRRPWDFEQEYMSMIIAWGYDASDVERKVLNPEPEADVIAAALGDAGEPETEEDDSDSEEADSDESEEDSRADADDAELATVDA